MQADAGLDRSTWLVLGGVVLLGLGIAVIVVDEFVVHRRDDMAHRVPIGRRAWRALKRLWDLLLGA